MSITPYGEASVPTWAQSAFKGINKRIAPQGARQYQFEQYLENDQQFNAEHALNIEIGNALMYREVLLNNAVPTIIMYCPNNDDQKLIEEFLKTAQVEVFKTAHGEVTHYTQ